MKKLFNICMVIAVLSLFFLAGGNKVKAEGAGEIEVTKIDYGNLTVCIDTAGNNICYYSKDKNKWYELEYIRAAGGDLIMDISWTNANADTKIYFKGDKNEKVVTLTLPKKNSALKCKFDAADGSLEFDETEDATQFQWKKSTDTVWTTVSLNESSASFKNFVNSLESLRFKGAKIIVRTPYQNGTGILDTGARVSKEITVMIPKRANAPSVSVNLTKLTVNTNDTLEYSLDGGLTWTDCEKNMAVSDILSGRASGTVIIRKAATEKAGYSKTATLVIPERAAAPAGISHYTENKMFVLQINGASTAEPYEYAVIKPGYSFDETTSPWRGISSSKPVKINKTTAPAGSIICVRKKGKAANAARGIALTLPSKYTQIVVTE
ncbi:MAG: hypothetical protein IKS09_03525 [Lachnospiraceae bacterium]|nr:hypothetical protein [Lachnospiraceae bacterium]